MHKVLSVDVLQSLYLLLEHCEIRCLSISIFCTNSRPYEVKFLVMAEGVLSANVIILIVILGASAVALCGYALHRTFASKISGGEWEKKFNDRNAEQDQYMVDLRMAYRNGVMADAQAGRPYHHKHQSFTSGNPAGQSRDELDQYQQHPA